VVLQKQVKDPLEVLVELELQERQTILMVVAVELVELEVLEKLMVQLEPLVVLV
jgi:hypothetical protein